MIGDVNIFLNDQDDDPTFGEIEIMIAEESYRRGGRGLEALKIMMAYGKVNIIFRTEPCIRCVKLLRPLGGEVT